MQLDDNAVVRFWAKVNTSGPIQSHMPHLGQCWEWTAHRSGRLQYGSFSVRSKHVAAHRFSFQFHCGAIPPGMFVLHHCDNPPCVRPTHLFLGTPADNNDDRDAKGRGVFIGARGVLGGSAKLCNKDVFAILDRIRGGESTARVAADYKIHPTAITNIIHGKDWQWLTHLPQYKGYRDFAEVLK